MKRRMRMTLLPLLAILALLPVACDFETSPNGKLDGMWHLQSVDTLATGGVASVADEQLYWCFQHNMLMVFQSEGYPFLNYYVMKFVCRDGRLALSEPHISDRLIGDPLLTDLSLIAPFGINTDSETFTMESLSGSKMTLSNGTLRLHLRKF